MQQTLVSPANAFLSGNRIGVRDDLIKWLAQHQQALFARFQKEILAAQKRVRAKIRKAIKGVRQRGPSYNCDSAEKPLFLEIALAV